MRRARIVIALALVIGLLLTPARGLTAARGTDSTPFGGFTLELEIENDGSLTIRELELDNVSATIPLDDEEDIELDIEGLQLRNINTSNLEKLLANLGIPAQIPDFALEPQQVGLLAGNGVEHLGLHKKSHGDWQELSLYVNNTKSLEVGLPDETLQLMLNNANLAAADMDLARSLLMMGEGRIIVHFPRAKTEFAFSDEIEDSIESPKNLIKAGATISGTASSGEVVSAGGVTIQETNRLLEAFGAETYWPYLLTNPLSVLETEVVTATAGRNGFRLDSGNGHWAKAAWDQEGRESLYQLISVALDIAEMNGYPLGVSTETIAATQDLVETALPWTDIQLTFHNGTKPAESSPEIQIGQVLTFEVGKEGNVLFEGVPAGTTSLDYAWIKALGPVAFGWDGAAKEVRYTANELPLPPLFVAEDSAVQTGNIAAASYPESSWITEVPWSKVDALLENTSIAGVVLATAGNAPDELDLEYSVKESIKPQTSMLPTFVLDRQGNIALGSEEAALNLTPYLEDQGISLAGILKPIPAGIEAARLTIDSNQVGAALNGASSPIMGIRWDYALRQNAFNTADKALGLRAVVNLATYGVVDAIFPYWEEAATEMVAGGRGFQWGVQLTIVDDVEELPPSPAENLLNRLGVSP